MTAAIGLLDSAVAFGFDVPPTVETLDKLARLDMGGVSFVLPLPLQGVPECPLTLGEDFSDAATGFQALALLSEVALTDERTDAIDVDRLVIAGLLFGGSAAGTGGCFGLEADERMEDDVDARGCGVLGGDALGTLTLTVDAADGLRDRTTERTSELTVLKVVEFVAVDRVESGRGDTAFRTVDACDRTDTKVDADDFGRSMMLDEVTLRRGVTCVVTLGDFGGVGLTNVTFLLCVVAVDADSAGKSSSNFFERTDDAALDNTLGVSFESGRGPGGGRRLVGVPTALEAVENVLLATDLIELAEDATC
jgi:hypothetical protein